MLNAQRTMPESQHSSSERSSPPGARCQDVKMRRPLVLEHCALGLVRRSRLSLTGRSLGFEAHKFIMDRAIALLPADLRPIFERHRAVCRASDRSRHPDHRRTVRRGGAAPLPRHRRTESYLFRELPRDYAAAVKKFGERRVQRDGTLPWRAQVAISTACGWRSTPCVNVVA